MSKTGLAFFAVFILIGSLLMMGSVGFGAPQPNSPLLSMGHTVSFPANTKIPYFTYAPVDAVVTISDAKLKAALHTVTGIPPQTPIYRSDLAKMAGGLDLSNKGIAKLDGLQYCENITDLNLSGNKLADLPSTLSKLANLQTLLVDNNKLTKIPDVVFTLAKLTTLSLKDNDIDKIPDKINTLSAVTSLNLSGNKIDTIPTNLGKLTKLTYLNLSRNGNSKKDLTKIPREICLLPVLDTLDISGNVISDLPKELATMPKLVSLNVSNNKLDELPAGLGNAPVLQKVDASRNRLTIIEPSLLNGKITALALDVNRLTDLPQGLSGKTFDTFSVEWNFMDMSDGSNARTIADSVVAPSGKYYMRQLKNIGNVQSQASINTVLLKWNLLQDGTDGDSSWKVSKYQIYLVTGDSWGAPVAELDKYAGQYVATKLKADKTYKFEIGVEYSLTLNGLKATHRYFTPVEVKTLNETAQVTITDMPENTAEVTSVPATTAPAQTTAPTATASAKPASGGSSSALLVVLIIISSIAAIALVGVLVTLYGRRKKQF